MDNGLTRREVLKGMAATAGLPYLGGEGNLAAEPAPSAPPAEARPPEGELVAPTGWPQPEPLPAPPGPEFAPPVKLSAPSPNAPAIFEHSQEAGPDQTFLMVGRGLTKELFVWGSSATGAPGQPWSAKIQFAEDHILAATLPETSADGVFLVWVGNAGGWSKPIRLNAPQPWWCGPDVAAAGDAVRIFGRNLARRPEYTAAFVYLQLPGQPGLWLNPEQTGKYSVTVRLPAQIDPGLYNLWVHAGRGGALGWGGPVRLEIQAARPAATSVSEPVAAPSSGQTVDLQALLNRRAQKGGGAVLLSEGFFPFHGTLSVPKGVTLAGAGRDKTRLQLERDAAAKFGPDEDAAAIWLTGDGASVARLTVSGTPEVNLGVAVKSPEPLVWLRDCRIEDVRIGDIERKHAPHDKFMDNYGVRLMRAEYATVRDNEIWARSPIFLSGVRKCCITGNDLYPRTLWGGNAEASIQGRNEVIGECIIEGNRISSPPGTEAGGPTTRRLIWLSTGHGSVTHNWVAGNGVKPPAGPGAAVGAGQARFGGVAGTDQNVGEMILFEANHRTMFFGKIEGADSQSVVLPQTVPATPENRLGAMVDGQNVGPRKLLARDAAGNETPFWPPDRDDGGEEPPIAEYFVTIFAGTGQGQTRRVVKREANRLILERPWNEPPAAGSLVAVGTGFYQNLIVGNYAPDGMTGVQLWISCIENVVANNSIARQRKEGIYLYASGTTLGSSMPRAWNRGIAPLFWNLAEGNRTEECSRGALVVSGDDAHLPVEFPRALGNVLRHNSFVRSREDGVALQLGAVAVTPEVRNTSASVAGTIAEFNVVRDAHIGYHAGPGSDHTVFRRDQAYFWFPVSNSQGLPVAFQVDRPGSTVALDENSAEGKFGVESDSVVTVKRAK
ncbi:MAG: hypothetical protein ABSG32_11495 [Terriglobia bacterium]|jgi:hypothetical protein